MEARNREKSGERKREYKAKGSIRERKRERILSHREKK